MQPTLYIVIPCYNEQEVLPRTAPLFLEKIDSLIEKGKIGEKSRILRKKVGALLHELQQKFAVFLS